MSPTSSFERTHYPLTLMIAPSSDFEFLLAYQKGRFDEDLAERLLVEFTTLLDGLAKNPDATVARLPLLTRGEQNAILERTKNTAVELPVHASLPMLFEHQARETPQSIAAQFEGQTITYDALRLRTNRLARHLRQLGVGAEVLVAVCLEPSLDLLVALIAIAKSGGAYVPLDPEYPSDRIQHTLEDSGAGVLVTNSKLATSLPCGNLKTVRMDTDSAVISTCSDDSLNTAIRGDDLAYVIYTSGSTGRPKGVMIPHASLANLLLSMLKRPGLAPEDVLLAVTTPCFDIAALELFLPLIAGGRVVIAPRDVTRNPDLLATSIDENGTTVMQATPATWQMLVQGGWKGRAGLKILCGGEPLSRDLADALLDRAGSLWNMYGPTETTVWSSVGEIRPRDQVITVGWPIANTTTYIVDENMDPVPVGVVGELYIGGAGLARGYHNRPELTREKFVSNPFGDVGSYLYRTGDLARFRADFSIECLGRTDHQVKIRGFRIELGEIEVALRQHSAICEAVVVGDGAGTADARLAAYLVLSNGIIPAESELRNHLRKTLPDYMVPAAFVVLDSLPLTPNGKIDRKALPAPATAATVEPSSGESYVEPRTTLERLIAGVWGEVLERERVGIRDNFFDVGGHSLLAVRVAAGISKVLGKPLGVNLLFEYPTVEELAGALNSDSGSPGSEAMFAAGQIGATEEPAEPALSFGEEGLLLLQQFEPENPFYNIPGALRIRGELNIDAMVQAVQTVWTRHETLRSRVALSGSTFVRSVATAETFHCEVRDLRQERDPHAALQHYLSVEARRPFRLEAELPFRACLLRSAEDDHTLFVDFNHVAADGWSLDLWCRELSSCYPAFLAEEEPDLPELPVRYSQYAAWERAWIDSEDANKRFAYWQQQLAGANPVLALPTDHRRPARLTYEGAVEALSITPQVMESLKALARSENATVFMVLLAGWCTLLSRYTGQEDIIVGSPIANRTHPETQKLIGLFMNMLPLRVDTSGQPSFRELLQRVRAATLGAYANQQYPFERLIQRLEVPRDFSRTPLFQNIFILQSAGPAEVLLPGLEVSWQRELHTGTAKTDVTLSLQETPEAIVGAIEYNTSLFEAATARQMARHFENLLEQAAAKPELAIPELSLLSETERDRILSGWNATSADYPHDKCFHELIAEQAERAPTRVAVLHQELSLTYGDLNARANRLAHFLRSHGVGPDVLAAVQLERSFDMLIALLAVCKAGGAYVPLDPAYPQERREFMLRDSGSPVLITAEYLSENAAAIAGESDQNLSVRSTPEDLAYVIYTSGSTGNPKGVEITHRAFLNFLWSFRATPGLKPEDALLAVTTISFDIAGLELFLPLITGAQTVIASREDAMQPDQLARLIEKHHISVMQATPTTWRLLVESGWAGKPDLKILCGGEALPHELAVQLQSRCRELWNVYGPTETTVWSSVQLLEPGLERVLIGRPIANTTMYVLDERLNLAAPPAVGELYIGGDGLARGYRNHPALTAAKFIESPFHPGCRLYRTGDLARWMPDGSIECLGRTDHQVKIRGFRIELGEIEAVIQETQGIRQVLVVALGKLDSQRLVAYLVHEPEHTPDTALIRAELKRRLPDYMVPAAFVVLDSLPLTPNGKIDRKALPAPDYDPATPATALEEPANDVERQIVEMYRQFLSTPSVGVHDKFFDIGGHSLLAVRLMSEIEKIFSLNLPLATLFEASSPRELAAVITDQRRKLAWTSLVRLKPGGTAPPLFCVHSLGANLVSYRHMAQKMHPDQPLYGLQPIGLDGENELHRTVEEMAAHYLKEIRNVQPRGPYNLSGVCLGGIVAFEMAQQLHAEGEETSLLALIDSYYVPQPRHLTKLPDRATPLHYADYYLGEILLRHGRERLRYTVTRISNILRRSGQALKRALGFKTSVTGSLARALQEIHGVHSAAERTYVPKTYPGRVTLFWCSNYPVRSYYDTRLGWCDVAGGGLEVHMIPGDHMSMLEPGNVEALAAELTSCLHRARAVSAPEVEAAHA